MAARAKEWMNKMAPKDGPDIKRPLSKGTPSTGASKPKASGALQKKDASKASSPFGPSRFGKASSPPAPGGAAATKPSTAATKPSGAPPSFGKAQPSSSGPTARPKPSGGTPSQDSPPEAKKVTAPSSGKISDIDPNLVGHITLHLPPPPGQEDRLKNHIESMRNNPFDATLGDTKANLDNIKAHLMGFYSKLYSKVGGTVDEKLNNLRDYQWPGGERATTAAVSSWNDQFFHEGIGSDPYQDVILNPNDAHPLASDLMPHTAVYSKTPRLKDRLRNNEEGVLGVLNDIASGVSSIENRMTTAKSVIDTVTEDPTLRTWAINAVPDSKQHPRVGKDFDEHCKTLYRHLKVRSVRNEERIKALQGRVRIMQLQSKNELDSIDPRRGF